jgi:O-antigen/teichoic acid export membrane protein
LRKISGAFGGIGDAGFAALANLGMGIIAVRYFDTNQLALYSLFFSGWIVAQLFALQVVFLPARLAVNKLTFIGAPNVFLDIRRGLWIVLCGGAIAFVSGLPLYSSVGHGEYIAMATAAASLTIVAPFHSHVRSSLHLVGRHGTAALCSLANLVIGAAVLVTVPPLIGYTPSFLPFAALAFSNLGSAIVGICLLKRVETATYDIVKFTTRVSYVGADLLIQVGGYVVSLIVAHSIGTGGLAQLEAARILTSPIAVIAAGLGSYFVPIAIRSYIHNHNQRLRRVLIALTGTILAGGVLYIIVLILFGRPIAALLGTHADSALGSARAGATTLDVSTSSSGA